MQYLSRDKEINGKQISELEDSVSIASSISHRTTANAKGAGDNDFVAWVERNSAFSTSTNVAPVAPIVPPPDDTDSVKSTFTLKHF